LHVPANLVGERNNILRFARQIAVDLFVQAGCALHALVELVFETGFFDLRRSIVAADCRKLLTFLSQNPVAMQIAIQAEVTEDVERIIDVLEGPPRFVAPMAPLTEMRGQYLTPLPCAHCAREFS